MMVMAAVLVLLMIYVRILSREDSQAEIKQPNEEEVR